MSAEALELARWAREPLPNGGFVLTAPGGPQVASLCVRPGVRPVRTLRSLVESVVEQAGPELQLAQRVGPVQRVVTDEGLDGALVPLRAVIDRAIVDWGIGIIVRDDELVIVEGTGRGPLVIAWTSRLMRTLALGLAPDRVRMFPYQPPDRWFGVRRDLATCWLAPEYPRHRATITVCDAVPLRTAASATMDLRWPSLTHGAREAIELPHLQGVRVRHGELASVDLDDGRFLYRVLLCGGSADDLAAVQQLILSIEPCTAPRRHLPSEMFEWMT